MHPPEHAWNIVPERGHGEEAVRDHHIEAQISLNTN
jgi:hypothetical protein